MTGSFDKPGYAALRQGRWSAPGQVYLLTFTTHDRLPLFTDPAIAVHCCRAIAALAHTPDGELLSWVLMPDHWHGLVQLGGRITLSQWVARLKSATTRHLPEGVARPVWEKGFHDHAVRQEEDLLQVARYIVGNPVRAGLVSRCGFYPWWDAVWF